MSGKALVRAVTRIVAVGLSFRAAKRIGDVVSDLHPHCSLGEVSFERRWTVRAPEAAGLPFRLEGDGIAIAMDVAHAAELHVQLGAALVENVRLRMTQAQP